MYFSVNNPDNWNKSFNFLIGKERFCSFILLIAKDICVIFSLFAFMYKWLDKLINIFDSSFALFCFYLYLFVISIAFVLNLWMDNYQN